MPPTWRMRTDEHGASLYALRKRDPAGTRAAMREHFHRLFESMLEATETDALAEVSLSYARSGAAI